MNRDFFRNCLILGIIGIVFVGGIAGLWYFFYGGGNGTLPVVQLVQPNETVTLASGQGLIVIARGQFSLGIDQIDLYVDGELLDSVSANGKSQAEVSFPWFATKVGFHELRVVARDQFGRASMPASVFVAVVKGSDPQYGIEPDSVLVSENFIGAGGDNPQADGNPQPGLPGELPPAEGGNGEAPEPVNPEPVGDQFANCQNPGQVVDELPVVELNVAAVPANNDRVSLQITGKADDNTGLTFLRVDVMASLIGQALHDSTTAACDGQAHCEINIGNVLVDPGRALVTLTAQDTNCQMTVSPVWQDQVGEAAVDAPPSVTIDVGIARGADGVAVATISIHAEDDTGLDRIKITVLDEMIPVHDMNPACNQALSCDFKIVHPVLEAQRSYLAVAIDRSGQESDQVTALLEGSGDPAAVAVHEDLLGQLAANGIPMGVDIDPGELFFDPVRAMAEMMGIDIDNPQADNAGRRAGTFNLAGCEIIQPVVLPDGPFTNCPHADLSYQDLSNLDLRYANFWGADFTEANLAHANLDGAILFESILVRADLRGTVLTTSNLNWAKLHDAIFLPATPQIDPKWRKVWDLVTNDREGRVIAYDDVILNMSYADLSGVNLTRTTLTGPHVWDITGSRLSGALMGDFTTPDFRYVECTGATFQNAWMMNVQDALICDGADFSNAVMDGSNLNSSSMVGANFSGASLNTAQLSAHFTGANLTNITANFANFNHADLTRANLRGAILDESTFQDTIWDNTLCPIHSDSDYLHGSCLGQIP